MFRNHVNELINLWVNVKTAAQMAEYIGELQREVIDLKVKVAQLESKTTVANDIDDEVIYFG